MILNGSPLRVEGGVEQDGERSYPIVPPPEGEEGDGFPEAPVPPGHYFVLGDHRGQSLDSRTFGFVPAERLVEVLTGR